MVLIAIINIYIICHHVIMTIMALIIKAIIKKQRHHIMKDILEEMVIIMQNLRMVQG